MAKFQMFVALVFMCVIANIKAACNVDNYFECPEEASKRVILYGKNELECPGGTLCNHNCLIDGEKIIKPCLKVEQICKYTCNAENVIINGVEFACPESYHCNVFMDSCEVCIPKPCDQSQYECKSETVVVFKDGTELKCPRGKVCNDDYVFPCTPCIDQ